MSPAISQPLMKPQSGNSPAQSAQINNRAQAESQASLARAVGGRRRRARRPSQIKRGGEGGIPAPQVQTPYPEPGGGNQNVNSIMKTNAEQQNQGGANAVYDNAARNMKGGTMWGCYSGGKRRRRRSCTKKKKMSNRKKRNNKKKTFRKRN